MFSTSLRLDSSALRRLWSKSFMVIEEVEAGVVRGIEAYEAEEERDEGARADCGTKKMVRKEYEVPPAHI